MARVAQDCKIHGPDEDLQKQFGRKAQLLFNVKKIRNHYFIEPSEIQQIAKMTAEEKKEFMSKDVD